MDAQVSDRQWQFLLKEYELVESKWRFLQGLRYGVIASITTLQATFVAAYSYMLSSITNPMTSAILHGNLTNADSYSLNATLNVSKLQSVIAYPALVFVPFFAICIIFATRVLEVRLQDMYSACSERGREIELMLGTLHGIFEKLHHLERTRFFKLDHSDAFKLIVLVTALMWFTLILIGAYLWFYRHP